MGDPSHIFDLHNLNDESINRTKINRTNRKEEDNNDSNANVCCGACCFCAHNKINGCFCHNKINSWFRQAFCICNCCCKTSEKEELDLEVGIVGLSIFNSIKHDPNIYKDFDRSHTMPMSIPENPTIDLRDFV